MEFGGIFALLILVGDIWAVVNVVQSSASTGGKIVWALLIFILPLIGLIIWYFAGPRKSRL